MRSRLVPAAAGMLVLSVLAAGQAPPKRLNPVIDLLVHKKPVFGLYMPGGRATPSKSASDLADEALAYAGADFLFSGSMERSVEGGLPAFAAFVSAMAGADEEAPAPRPHLRRPLAVKTPKIASDPAKAIDNISRQLNLGVAAIVFVDVEDPEELRQGLAAMRFTSRGGTRPDAIGSAPAYWGMTERQYRERADLWPLNPNGELVSWAIVESPAGLARVREIAAVKGLGVLFPGAGTLRGVFTRTGADGQRTFDGPAWEAAIQKVLAACKEFSVPCGYPARAADIELRMQQGFSVFIMNWGPDGFTAVDLGRKASGR